MDCVRMGNISYRYFDNIICYKIKDVKKDMEKLKRIKKSHNPLGVPYRHQECKGMQCKDMTNTSYIWGCYCVRHDKLLQKLMSTGLPHIIIRSLMYMYKITL